MKKSLLYSFVFLLVLSASVFSQDSQWVRRGASGNLLYQLDSKGDRILDYSEAGFNRGAEIPSAESLVDASRIIDLAPIVGDNRLAIQNAIAQVAGMSRNADGYRGIVRLAAGQFDISNTILLNASGVILQGMGDGGDVASNTILRSTSTSAINLVEIGNPSGSNTTFQGRSTLTGIADKVVPAGATSFRVTDTSALAVGDWVNVRHFPLQAWYDALGINDPSWAPGNPRFNTQHERRITRIEGDRVFLHSPLSHSIDSRLATGTIESYQDDRFENIGITGIRGTSVFDSSQTAIVDGRQIFSDENHAASFIRFGKVKESWAKDITGQHLRSSAVDIGVLARNITVENAKYIDPVSLITGGRRYAFNTQGSHILMKNLEVDSARRAFINNTTFNGHNRGPNVFFNGQATNSFVRSGPHANYSTGALYDNIFDSKGYESRLAFSPISHGWRGAHAVLWNSVAARIEVINTPISRNYSIGSIGEIAFAGGTIDSHGTPVDFSDADNPLSSLYIQQVLQRERFPSVEQREYWVGDVDQLENDGASDSVPVDAQWLLDIENISQFISNQQTIGFDSVGFGTKVPFTINFGLASGETVQSAVLTLGMNRNGADSSDNDVLYLDSSSNLMSFAAGEWGYQEDGETLQVLTFELEGNLDYLQDGQLNGLLTNNRALDFVQLIANVSTDPEPTVLLGDVNQDGFVSFLDIAPFIVQLMSVSPLEEADVNEDGFVNFGDIAPFIAILTSS